MDLPKVPTWRLERDSKRRPSGQKASSLPMRHHTLQRLRFVSLQVTLYKVSNYISTFNYSKSAAFFVDSALVNVINILKINNIACYLFTHLCCWHATFHPFLLMMQK